MYIIPHFLNGLMLGLTIGSTLMALELLFR